jgi:hypothetical protein
MREQKRNTEKENRKEKRKKRKQKTKEKEKGEKTGKNRLTGPANTARGGVRRGAGADLVGI